MKMNNQKYWKKLEHIIIRRKEIKDFKCILLDLKDQNIIKISDFWKAWEILNIADEHYIQQHKQLTEED